MRAAELPVNEDARLRALRDLEQLDTPPDEVLDAVTSLAASICTVPIALISLIDESRQWFKSAVGLATKETARELAFCAHAILKPSELMEVQDATADSRFHDNPLVVRDPHIRFYAGVPLVNDHGLGLGTLCVIDRAPRALTPAQKGQLRELATIVVHVLETTRNKRALTAVSAALKRTEQQFRLMFENAPIGMTLADSDGQYVRANPAFFELVGYDESELPGLTSALLTHPDDRAEDAELGRDLVSGLQSHGRRRKRYLRKDGRLVHVDVHVSRTLGDSEKSTGFITQVIDITAELAAEARIRESEALLSSLIESVPDAIMSVDRDGRLTTFNSRVVDDIYRTHGVHVARGMRLFDLGDEQTRSLAAENQRRCLQGESLRFEWAARENDGKAIHLLISHTPMVSGGEIFGAAIVVTDITARRAMEVALLRRNREIELLGSIATTANEALTAGAAIERVLELVAKFGDWAAGHSFVLVGGELVSQKIWYMQDPAKLERFRDESESLRFRTDVGLPGRVLKTECASWMTSLENNPAFLRAESAKKSQLRTSFAFPVFVGREIVSVLEFFSERDERPSDDLEDLSKHIGRQVGRVLERERHAAEMRSLSLTDELTGIYNRRGFSTLVGQQLLVAGRSGSASMLFSFDLNGLKRINDQLGHEAGDEVIFAFATLLRRTFRRADIVARFGGDEFVAFATSCGSSGTALARLDGNLQAQNLLRPPSVALSASIGVIEVPADTAESLEVLLARADALMYEDKRTRHDRNA